MKPQRIPYPHMQTEPGGRSYCVVAFMFRDAAGNVTAPVLSAGISDHAAALEQARQARRPAARIPAPLFFRKAKQCAK